MKTCKKLLFSVLVLTFTLSSLFAETNEYTNTSDAILAADIPIKYGDAAFRKRILEKTQGQRSPVGLVLSGGSARAFAHIGVLKYLEEQGIVPDFIISNSMGSIVGLMYAAGMSADQILESVTSVSLQTLFDLTFPLEGGILDPSRFLAKMTSILGQDLQLETLSIPIIVVSEDLVTKRQIQISEGDFYTVLQASFALPVYFPPVAFKGHLLLDGGITNLVPIKLAYEYADSVIVSTTFYDVDTLNLKNPLTLLNVSIDISKRRRGVEELKAFMDDSIWIRCAVEDISFMEFSSVKELTAKGYASAKLQQEKLQTLPQTLSDEFLDEKRQTYSKRMALSQEEYRLFSHEEQYKTSLLFSFGFDSEQDLFDDNYLKDDNTLGIRFALRSGDLNFTVNTGMALQSYINDRMAALPAIRTQLDYYFLKYFKVSANASTMYDFSAHAFQFSLGGTLDGRIYLLDDTLRLRFLQSVEHLSNTGGIKGAGYWDGHIFLSSTGFDVLYAMPKKGNWNLKTAQLAIKYQVLGDYSSNRAFLAPQIGFALNHTPTDLFADFSTSLRFALDGKGDVPFFLSDGFRTNNAAIRSQGHDLTTSVNSANYLAATRLTLGYRPHAFKPSMAELLIFENSSIGAYFDFLWSETGVDAWKPTLSMGLELHTDISLLGISTLPFTLYGGWDQSTASIVWGFWFNIVI